MRIVAVNDDGVRSPGLHALARACAEAGHEVVVVAPAHDMSGMSSAIGPLPADRRVRASPADEAGLAGIVAHAVEATPGLCAMVACLGGFGEPPDVVVSGINAGPNTGHATLHSGTVGAALTASTFGVSALAASTDVGDAEPVWDAAVAQVPQLLDLLAELPRGTVLNLNAPSRRRGDVEGVRWATLDRFGAVRLALADADALQVEYRETGAGLDPACDTALLAAGWCTLTALEGVAAIEPERLRTRAGRDVHVGARERRAAEG